MHVSKLQVAVVKLVHLQTVHTIKHLQDYTRAVGTRPDVTVDRSCWLAQPGEYDYRYAVSPTCEKKDLALYMSRQDCYFLLHRKLERVSPK